ncbi:MFS transporter [bacterium]|nr:MAG: MFS transporter [bacterium]
MTTHAPAEDATDNALHAASAARGDGEGAPLATTRGGHPRALYLLFTAEMWERMSYYGMRALLVLYMTRATTAGGFGWSSESALKLYGLYSGLVYMTPFFGGIVADRWLGQRRSMLLGGLLMMIGHFLMALPGITMFFVAVSFIIVGNGFFKPNVSTMVGALYPQNDPRRDAGFTIFYMGINIGSFLASAICGTLGEKLGFHWGFGSAGVGMGLGLVVFAWGAPRFLGRIGVEPSAKRADAASTSSAATTPTEPLTKVERDRITVLFVLAFFSVFFWVAFEQAGGLMNLYTDQKVDRVLFGWEIPTTWFQALNPIFVVTMAPLVSAVWTRRGAAGKSVSTPKKMALGILLVSVGFMLMIGAARVSQTGSKAHMLWIVGAYFFHTAGELCISPIGLSVVTKLAPARLASMLMGVWFLSNFVSDTLAGFVGSYSEALGDLPLFTSIVVATLVSATVLLAVTRPLEMRMHGRD